MTRSQARAAVVAILKKWEDPFSDIDMCNFNETVRRFELRLTSTPITGRIRKLRVRWTAEEDQMLDAEVEPGAEEDLKMAIRAAGYDA